jgi:hypothetical protein
VALVEPEPEPGEPLAEHGERRDPARRGTLELLQWEVIDGRAGDVDDVLLNAAGAALTALLLERLRRAVRRTPG